MTTRALAAIAVALLSSHATAQSPDVIRYQSLLDAIEHAVLVGEPAGYLSLLSPAADQNVARQFTTEHLRPSLERATLTPRLEVPLATSSAESEAYQVTVEIFTEAENQGRLETWELEILQGAGEQGWHIQDQTAVDAVDGLFHLELNPTIQYDADNLVINREDMSLTLAEGSVFVAETADGVTGVVLLGNGTLNFTPEPEAEQGQVRIFSGQETLESEFEAAFIRLHPDVFRSRVPASSLRARTVDPDALRDAQDVFDKFIALSFTLDLSDISDRLWSLTPSAGDFLAEVHTNRYGTLTYTQSGQQPEDISLYERESGRIIALYPSAKKRITQGRYFGVDDSISLDVLDYDVKASFQPLGSTRQDMRSRPELIGCRIVGTTRLALRVKGLPTTGFSLRLADELAVSSVTSNEFGPLLFFRLNGQNNLIVNLPEEIRAGTEFTLTIQYEGDLRAQELDENWIANQYSYVDGMELFGIAEPRYIYSNRSYWYPQALNTDYATATMNLSVPEGWNVVASGNQIESTVSTEQNSFSFVAVQPTRYLSAVVTRFEDRETPVQHIHFERDLARPTLARTDGAVYYDTLSINAYGSPQSVAAIDTTIDKTAEIASFYASLLGDLPYPSITVALTDARMPGGHSPAYLVVLNHELPRQPGMIVSWKTDPVSFSSFPSFFLAHELAHQWWGQAVGWKNYHEQWLSEGLAQYFAALYAEHEGGEEVFDDVIRQMRRWAVQHSAEGPVYLGYRLGHLEREPRVFRALVYNKGAMVLHMLRRLIGDDAFFAGLRRFYQQWRFQKAGTDGLQLAFEIESNRSLSRFFDRWIHEAALPELQFSSRTERTPEGEHVVLRFDQLSERLFDVPVAVDLHYRSGEEDSVIVAVTDRATELRVPLRGRLRRIRVDDKGTTLAEINR
jgi:hypothetical protein